MVLQDPTLEAANKRLGYILSSIIH